MLDENGAMQDTVDHLPEEMKAGYDSQPLHGNLRTLSTSDTLQFNEFVNTVPTKGFNTEKIKVTLGCSRTVTFHFWDVGGQEKLRPLWKSYTRCTDGIIFVVDSVDAERMEEAKTELHKITRLSENQGVPVLVVANKQDLRNSLTLIEIEKLLALRELGAASPWHLQPACAIIGDGLKEGLERLHDMILKLLKDGRRTELVLGNTQVSVAGGTRGEQAADPRKKGDSVP
ncbi:hypothetical protein JZ751_009767 [Albula glossodonta]|uniref:ADP-ribosylation factor-like protein 6 n=1 Tax=Albula glossodonta TaxID=121402 RepID=A0A8T2P1I3_9TELE|nr:hypothetical protein JZ751_009767 [Albula glossodonta]